MKKLALFLAAVLREIFNHGPLIVAMVALVMGHLGIFLMLLMLAFYFKLAELVDHTRAWHQAGLVKIEFKPEAQPVLDTVIVSDAKEEHF